MLKILIFLISTQSHAVTDVDLKGHWKFSEIIYQEHRLPLPNPDLNLQWEFFSNGTSRLYWDRGTRDFCERFAHYTVKNQILTEEVFALNPKNATDCVQDPDMKLGRKTNVPISLYEKEMHMHFQIGDEQLIYVLIRLTH